MKYTIKGKPESLKIKLDQLGDEQQKVLESLQDCAEGKCECPTPQYEKLESIQISRGADSVSIELKARTGETIKRSDIQKCLEYTARKAARP